MPAKLPRRPQGRSCRPATLLARLTSNWHISLNIQETPLSNIMQHLDIQGDMQIRCEEGRLDGTWVLTPLSLSARRDFPISLTGGGEREKGRRAECACSFAQSAAPLRESDAIFGRVPCRFGRPSPRIGGGVREKQDAVDVCRVGRGVQRRMSPASFSKAPFPSSGFSLAGAASLPASVGRELENTGLFWNRNTRVPGPSPLTQPLLSETG